MDDEREHIRSPSPPSPPYYIPLGRSSFAQAGMDDDNADSCSSKNVRKRSRWDSNNCLSPIASRNVRERSRRASPNAADACSTASRSNEGSSEDIVRSHKSHSRSGLSPTAAHTRSSSPPSPPHFIPLGRSSSVQAGMDEDDDDFCSSKNVRKRSRPERMVATSSAAPHAGTMRPTAGIRPTSPPSPPHFIPLGRSCPIEADDSNHISQPKAPKASNATFRPLFLSDKVEGTSVTKTDSGLNASKVCLGLIDGSRLATDVGIYKGYPQNHLTQDIASKFYALQLGIFELMERCNNVEELQKEITSIEKQPPLSCEQTSSDLVASVESLVKEMEERYTKEGEVYMRRKFYEEFVKTGKITPPQKWPEIPPPLYYLKMFVERVEESVYMEVYEALHYQFYAEFLKTKKISPPSPGKE